jgi:hypothetical protein
LVRLKEAIKILHEWDHNGKFIFTKHEFVKLFPDDNPKALSESLVRLVKEKILQRV